MALPFSKRKLRSEEIEVDVDLTGLMARPNLRANVVEELDDADIIEDPEHPSAPLVRASAPPRRLASRRDAEKPSLPTARRWLAGEADQTDVADECLTSIAQVARGQSSRNLLSAASWAPPRSGNYPVAAQSSSSSFPAPPSSTSGQLLAPPRLPRVTSPPFVRTSLVPRVPTDESSLSLEHVERSRPAFVRTQTGAALVDAGTTGASVAPVAMGVRSEPTVIVVRERPKGLWIVASAVVGAACAVAAMRFVTSSPAADTPPAAVVAAPVAPPAPSSPVSTAIVAPVTTITASAPEAVAPPPAAPASVDPNANANANANVIVTAPTTIVSTNPAPPPAVAPAPQAPATVKIREKDAVSIPAPPARPASAPAPATHPASPARTSAPSSPATPSAPKGNRSSSPGMLPDGSLTLSRNESIAPVPPTPAPVAPSSPLRKKAMTPEQELAEAQLRAAAR